MTVDQLIAELQKVSAQGRGHLNVRYADEEYGGAEDVVDVKFVQESVKIMWPRDKYDDPHILLNRYEK